MTRLRTRSGLFAQFVLVGLVTAAPAGAAQFTVNSTADTHDANLSDPACKTAAGTCTLRAAIDQSNGSTAADVIVLRAGTYQLSSHWFRNLLADPRVSVRIGSEGFRGRARVVEGGPEEEAARRLVAGKYDRLDSDWRRSAVVVAVDLEA